MSRDGRDGIEGLRGARGARGADGAQGLPGASAYEIACLRGFDGTEADWHESLRGDRGAQGDPGIEGKQGEIGPRGPTGPEGPLGDMPRHEWDEPRRRVRFEQGPTGEAWGEWSADLQGPPGPATGGGIGGGAVNLGALINSYDPIGF